MRTLLAQGALFAAVMTANLLLHYQENEKRFVLHMTFLSGHMKTL